MTITFHPNPGTILLCAYEPGFKEPEMVKTRPALIITPRLRRRHGLCTVIPLSTTAPAPAENWHHEFKLEQPLPKPWDSETMWAKADMFATVGFHRLSLIGVGRDHEGKRKYIQPTVSADDFKAIQRCVMHALNLPIP